ncbi:MAG TPA: hypothetical protein VFO25_08100 [Candidatus Eremiobacteraceae bacterium]|nr:hypothetical protein [Candidatus Eremiobacteraceae bacterium]
MEKLIDSGGDGSLIIFGPSPGPPRAGRQHLRDIRKEIASAEEPAPESEIPGPAEHAVRSSRIRKNLDKALDALRDVFQSSVGKKIGEFELDEIEVGLEISTDGKVGVLGVGIGVSGKSNITIKFKRAGKSE